MPLDCYSGSGVTSGGSHLFADKLPKAVLRIDSGRVYDVV